MSLKGSGEVLELAPAKVNLWLYLLGRREDGYHELETAMLALELADKLRARATRSGGVSLTLGGPAASADIPADEHNLVWQVAAAGLRRARELGRLDERAGVELALEKHIPSRAGLGGGSSDAAACLRAVERAWGVDLGVDWRRATLARSGADCVFFHEPSSSRAALCSGIGERVRVLDGPPPRWWVLLVTPDAECSTAEVFGAWRGTPGGARELPRLTRELFAAGARDVRKFLHNDLEQAALETVPELRAWRALLDREGLGHARLSGSGASFFALLDEREEARAALARLAAAARAEGLATRHAEIYRACPGA